ncbi:MAG: surface carbohydrate biosynthesis protein, partial [Xanthobacteraceae bacterium]
MAEPAVLLVDSKHRDLAGAALIARHLAARGVECHLEPLEAFKAVVGAHRPGIIVFNHLTASHLVAWSKRLAAMNILTAVLPNEGITYDDEARQYDANRRHKGAHIDHFFCWNEKHREALISEGFGERTQFHVVGVPRFDFYFEPWSQLFEIERQRRKPRILICTNFPTARFKTLPREHADALFKGWLSIPRYRDYWAGIDEHYQARERFFDFVDRLVEQDRYEIIVRPHPVEGPEFYEKKIAEKPSRKAVALDVGTNVTRAIIAADLVIQCETCTTALESWIRQKPTVSLVFGRNRLWYY